MLLGLIAAALGVQGQTLDLQAYAEEKLSAYSAPGLAVIVVDAEQPTEIAVAGLRQAGRAEAVTLEDRWHIGSNVKSMTATLALALVEDGKISLETTVAEQLGDDYRVDPAWSDVTLADLLSHRSGAVPNPGRMTALRYILFPSRGEEGPAKDRKNVLKGFLKSPPAGEQGGFVYSNLGYTIAGEMLGDAAGTTYEAALADHLFEPLGMANVLLGAPKGAPGSYNSGHRGDPPAPAPAGADNPAFASPAGTFSLTPHAYGLYLRDQLVGHSGAEALLSPEGYRELRTPRGEDGQNYALGWGVTSEGWLSHSGSNTMWYAVALVAPDRGLAVAILTNAEPIPGVGDDLRELMDLYGDAEPSE